MEFKNLWGRTAVVTNQKSRGPLLTPRQGALVFHGACVTGGSSAAPAPREPRGPGVPAGPRLGRGSSSTWPAGVASGEAGDPPRLTWAILQALVFSPPGRGPRGLLIGGQLSQPPALTVKTWRYCRAWRPRLVVFVATSARSRRHPAGAFSKGQERKEGRRTAAAQPSAAFPQAGPWGRGVCPVPRPAAGLAPAPAPAPSRSRSRCPSLRSAAGGALRGRGMPPTGKERRAEAAPPATRRRVPEPGARRGPPAQSGQGRAGPLRGRSGTPRP